VQKGPFALEDVVHEKTHGLRQRENYQKKDNDLSDTEKSHLTTSKFFRPKQRVHQINEQTRGDDSRNQVFHGILPKGVPTPW